MVALWMQFKASFPQPSGATVVYCPSVMGLITEISVYVLLMTQLSLLAHQCVVMEYLKEVNSVTVAHLRYVAWQYM